MKFFYPAFLFIAVVLSSSAAFCQTSIYIKATTSAGVVIQGSSTLIAHANEIEAVSFSNGARICSTGTCQPVLQELALTLILDKSTNLLRAEMFKGLAFQAIEISLRKGGTTFDYYKVKMEAVKLTSMVESTNADTPYFQLSFLPVRIGWIYNSQNPNTGALNPPVKFGWDFNAAAEWPSGSF